MVQDVSVSYIVWHIFKGLTVGYIKFKSASDMANKASFLLLTVVILTTSAQQFLPKESDYLPVNDLYAKDIARIGRDTFYKVQQRNAATVISAYPVRPNALTKVTFYLDKGNGFHFAVGQKNIEIMKQKGDVFYLPNSVFYSTFIGNLGQKFVNQDGSDYATCAYQGIALR